MCARYLMNIPAPELLELFGLPAPSVGPDLQPRYNIAPTQTVPVVRQRPDGAGRELILARWGLVPFWAKDTKIGYSLINARADGIASKPAFRVAFKSRRGLMPTTGFYEWKAAAGDQGKQGATKAPKQPYFISLKGGGPFAFAALWEQALVDGEAIDSCSLITTEPNALMASIHNRMPVILASGDYAGWLDPQAKLDDLQALLRPYPADDMRAVPVSTYVNNVRNQGPQCVEPTG
jgi:putative SOS response-associated peptidase YedK